MCVLGRRRGDLLFCSSTWILLAGRCHRPCNMIIGPWLIARPATSAISELCLFVIVVDAILHKRRPVCMCVICVRMCLWPLIIIKKLAGRVGAPPTSRGALRSFHINESEAVAPIQGTLYWTNAFSRERNDKSIRKSGSLRRYIFLEAGRNWLA